MADRTLEKRRDDPAADVRERLRSAEGSIRRLVERLDKLWLDLRAAEDKQRSAEAAAMSAERTLSERYQELAVLTNLLRQREEDNGVVLDKLAVLSDQHSAAQNEKSDLLAKNAKLLKEVEKLSDRIIEQEQEKTSILEQKSRLSEQVETLSNRLREQDEMFNEHLQWSAKVIESSADQPGWWGGVSASSRQRRRQEQLRRLGLFDAHGYLDRNPDVAEAGLDPLHHYLSHGFAEGRSR